MAWYLEAAAKAPRGSFYVMAKLIHIQNVAKMHLVKTPVISLLFLR